MDQKQKYKRDNIFLYDIEKLSALASERVVYSKLQLKKLNKRVGPDEVFDFHIILHLFNMIDGSEKGYWRPNDWNPIFYHDLSFIECNIDERPLVYSAQMCGVFEFNNTIAVRVGYKRDGLIRVSKKVFARLFVANEHASSTYNSVDLVSIPEGVFEHKFLNYAVVIEREPNEYDKILMSNHLVIPDCVVRVSHNRVCYAFSDREYKIRKMKMRYTYRMWVWLGRAIVSACYFIKYGHVGIIKSNFFFYKCVKLLRQLEVGIKTRIKLFRRNYRDAYDLLLKSFERAKRLLRLGVSVRRPLTLKDQNLINLLFSGQKVVLSKGRAAQRRKTVYRLFLESSSRRNNNKLYKKQNRQIVDASVASVGSYTKYLIPTYIMQMLYFRDWFVIKPEKVVPQQTNIVGHRAEKKKAFR